MCSSAGTRVCSFGIKQGDWSGARLTVPVALVTDQQIDTTLQILAKFAQSLVAGNEHLVEVAVLKVCDLQKR